MKQLRPYQQKAVDEIREALVKYRRVLFQLPTGGGKSLCMSYIAFNSQKYGHRVLLLSHRSEILLQNGGALAEAGLDVEYINPKSKQVPSGSICVGMAQTLRRRVEKEEWREFLKTISLCIVDESHDCSFDFIYPCLSDSCFRLLVTATPCRQGKQAQLGEFVKAMVTGVSVKELISMGYLAPARHFSIAAPKLDDVELDSNTKEYNQKSLARKFEDKRVYEGVVNEWLRICPTRKTIVFCVSSKQAIEITKILVERGVKAKYLLSGSFEDDNAYSGERNEITDAFKRGDFNVLVNVGITTAGFDCPDVDCIVANFATTSMSKWKQAIGRGSRIAEGKKDFIILDAGDNIRRLGFYDQDTQYSLWHDVSQGGGLQPMKTCPQCGEMLPCTLHQCPKCGHIWHTEKELVQLHLEEVAQEETQSLSAWAAQKKLEGWSLHRILFQTCLANIGEEKKAFIEVYTTLYPEKGIKAANAYWYIFNKQIWSKSKRKQSNQNNLPI